MKVFLQESQLVFAFDCKMVHVLCLKGKTVRIRLIVLRWKRCRWPTLLIFWQVNDLGSSFLSLRDTSHVQPPEPPSENCREILPLPLVSGFSSLRTASYLLESESDFLQKLNVSRRQKWVGIACCSGLNYHSNFFWVAKTFWYLGCLLVVIRK